MTLLDAHDLRKTYRLSRRNVVEALRGVDVTIEAREMVAIMGPSGSGKSTLMHILGLLHAPDRNGGPAPDLSFDGQPVADLADSARTRIRAREMGFVFQSFNLVPTLSALENVALAAEYAGVRGARARAAATESLGLVGLADRAAHRPSELSGGEQQRVAIARALVNRPKLVLADEPTGNLDSARASEVMGLLRRLNREDGHTFIIVTHDPEVGAACDRVIRMRDGRVHDAGQGSMPTGGGSVDRDARFADPDPRATRREVAASAPRASSVTRLARSFAALALALALVACGGAPGSEGTAATQSAAAETEAQQPLECETNGYPCLLSDAPPDTVVRSRQLGVEAMARISGGATPEAASAWLRDQDGVAESVADGPTIRFRLDGGRPTWVLSDVDAGVARNALRAGPRTASLTDQAVPETAPVSPPQSVVGMTQEAKHAIVLAPYAFADDMGPVRDLVRVLEGTRGYEGRVTFLQNTTRDAFEVTSDAFRLFDGKSVVYVQSLGGTICRNGATPESGECDAVILAEPLDDPDFHLTPEADAVLDIVVMKSGEEAIGVGADFFRHVYPQRPPNALILFDVKGTHLATNNRLALSIKDRTSDYYIWPDAMAGPQWHARADAFLRYVTDLSRTGRSTETVFHEMRPTLAADDVILRGLFSMGYPALRIREVISLHDSDTGEPLADGDRIVIGGTPGDGQPDRVPFAVEVDGLDAEAAARTTVNIVVDGVESEPLLASEAEQVDELTWRLHGEVEVPDVAEGGVVAILAVAQLPEGGVSQVTRSLQVAGLPDLGTVWVGEFTASWSNDGVVTTRTARATFERWPGTKPDATYITYELVDGTMDWSISGQSKAGCSESASSVSVPIPAGTDGAIRFDISGAASGIILYDGSGKVPSGPSVTVDVSCPDRAFEYTTRAEGQFFLAPEAEGFSLTGATAEGSYVTGGQIPVTHTWRLSKVE